MARRAGWAREQLQATRQALGRISPDRPILSYGKVTQFCSVFIRGTELQARRPSLRAKRYLNLGCGSNIKPGFINLDYNWGPGIDLCWDLNEPLPLADRSLVGVYSEHCIEHLERDVFERVLADLGRTLQPGGHVRFVVPDIELYMDLYARARRGEAVELPYGPNPLPEGTTTMMAIAPVFFSYGHRYAYDEATLRALLSKAGFVDIQRAAFGAGRDPMMLIDSESRKVESLYVEATWPG